MTFTGTLTAEQVAAVTAERDRWMAAGLSTEPCDRDAAASTAHAAYRAAGIHAPPLTVWMDSPLGGCFAAGMLGGQLGGQLRGQLWGQLWGQLRGQLGGQLWGQLGGQLRGQLGGQLRGQLRGQLWDQLGDQLGGQLGDQLGDQLWDQLGDQLRGQLGVEISCWWDAYWLALYRKALPIAELPASDHLDQLSETCLQAGWWWPLRGAVILTDRPALLQRDVEARLHADDGPALAYRDGYSLYALHGVRVPTEVIEDDPRSWTMERIVRDLDNSEIRRVAAERIGWDRLEAQLGAPVHTCPDPANAPHELRLYDLPEALFDEPVRLVCMTNASPDRDGTVRRYGETVPAGIDDAVAAQAWAWDVPADEYRQLQRAT